MEQKGSKRETGLRGYSTLPQKISKFPTFSQTVITCTQSKQLRAIAYIKRKHYVC